MPYAKTRDPTPAQIRRRAAKIQAGWTAADEAIRRGVHHLQIRDRKGHMLDLVLDQDGRLALPVYVRGIEWVDDRG